MICNIILQMENVKVIEMKSRIETAREEITQNPIFLLQRRRLVVFPSNEITYEGDCCYDAVTKVTLSENDLLRRELAVSYWDTVTVFLTREDATEYAEARNYDFGRKNIDWRVYCIPCNGKLAEDLKRLYPKGD